MDLQRVVNYQQTINGALPVDKEIALSSIKGSLAAVIRELKKNPVKLMLSNTIDNYIAKGWDTAAILSETLVKNKYSLLMCLWESDKVEEITEEYIKIKKQSGEIQYYEKTPYQSKNR